MDGGGTEQVDLRPYLQAFWRRKWLFLAVFLSLPALVYAVSTQIEKTYEAEVTLQVRATSVDAPLFSDQVSVSSSSLAAATELITTTAVARQAQSELGGGGNPRALLSQIEVAPLPTASGESSDLLAISATANDPRRAAAIANAFARAVDRIRAQSAVQQINQTIARLEEQQGDPEVSGDPAAQQALAEQLQELRGIRAAQQNNAETIEPAFPPGEPVAPNPMRNTALAMVLSLLLGLGAVGLAERLDKRLRKPEELEPLVGAPLLSAIPDSAFPGRAPHPGAVREAFQTLQASLTYFNVDKPLKSVMVTSPTRGDGKTTVSTYLAIALARDGKDVVLIDGDMRRPQAAARVGVNADRGLSEVLVGKATLEETLVDVDAEDGRMRVLPSGATPPNPGRLMGSESFAAMLTELTGMCDIVVVDTPPMLTVSDAVPLLERVSGTVLTAQVGHTDRDAVERMAQIIEKARGALLGAVATGVRAGGLHGYYGYGYYSDDYGDSTPDASGNGAGATPAENGTGGGFLSGARRRLTRK